MADSTVDVLVDVVVVGAGLSGLVCARELKRQGLAVQVLEARASAGGRMRGHSSGLGLRLDLGGQWVGATHQRLLALLEEFGLRRFPTHYDGEGLFHWNGAAHRAGVEHDFGSSLLFFRPAELGLPAAEVAATLELFVQTSSVAKQRDSQDAGRFIDAQIQTYEAKLGEVEERRRLFKASHAELAGPGPQEYFSRVLSLTE